MKKLHSFLHTPLFFALENQLYIVKNVAVFNRNVFYA